MDWAEVCFLIITYCLKTSDAAICSHVILVHIPSLETGTCQVHRREPYRVQDFFDLPYKDVPRNSNHDFGTTGI